MLVTKRQCEKKAQQRVKNNAFGNKFVAFSQRIVVLKSKKIPHFEEKINLLLIIL